MPQNVTIQLSVKAMLLLTTALVVLWLMLVFNKLVLLLFLASLLAIAIAPLVHQLHAWHLPRALAILLIYVALVSIVGAIISLLVPVLIAEGTQLSANLPALVLQWAALPRRWLAASFPALGNTVGTATLTQQFQGQLGSAAGSLGNVLLQLAETFTTLFFDLLLVLVITFVVIIDPRFTPRLLARFVPQRSRPHATALTQELGLRLGHWVRAQLMVCILYGATFAIGLALLGVPYALSLGLAGAVLELIPYLGGALITLIAMLIAATISPWLALAVLVLELVLALVESHIVYPKLVGNIVGLHPLMVILALFLGAEAGGVVGVVVAVPVAIIVQVLFDEFYRVEPDPDLLHPDATPNRLRGR